MKLEVSEKCVGCGACVKDCPVGALKLENGRAAVRKTDVCINCLHCVAVCPTAALTMNGVGAAACASESPLPKSEEVKNLIRQRRSIRQYSDESLARSEIDELIEVINYAPTGCNARTTGFLVLDSKEKVAKLKDDLVALLKSRFQTLPEFLRGPVLACIKNPAADPFFRHAPHILIAYAKAGAVTPLEDCVAACAYFDVLTKGCGLGATWCGFLKMIVDAVPEAIELLPLPRGTCFYAMLFGKADVTYCRIPPR